MVVVFIILLVVGLLAGLIAGLFGLGGGILFAPVLLFLFQSGGVPEPVLWTVGTSLICNFFAALSSSFKHFQMGNLYVREGVTTGLFGVIGTFIGRFIATSPYYSEREFTIFFILILSYSLFHFLRNRKPRRFTTGDNVAPMRWYQSVSIGLASGALATLAGVGGGLILVPVMTIILSFGFLKVVSISSLAIVMITLSGWIQLALLNPSVSGYSGLHIGYVDIGVAFPLIAGSFFGARKGVRLLSVIRLRTLELALSVLLLFVVARLLYGLF
ncbi:MAG: sulfite exporter TauE/SafE family protein [Bacteroidota bacterium]